MSTEDKKEPLDNFAAVEFTDITDFLVAADVKDCPACGNKSWTIVYKGSGENGALVPLIPMGNRDVGLMGSQSIPMFICACKRCGFLRAHARMPLIAWLADGKKPIENE